MIQPRPERHQLLVPEEYSGKWIAWDAEETQIVACGTTYEECSLAASEAGVSDPVFQKVPDTDELFLGMAP